MQDDVSTILKTVDDVVYLAMDESPEKWRETLNTFIGKLESLHKRFPDDTRLFYALGYCWFNMPDSENSDFDHAQNWLQKALDSNSEDYYATLYLGALLFEYGKYHDTCIYLERIPKRYFEDYDQKWRDLKIEEMLLCCEIYLNPDNIQIDHLKGIIQTYLEDTKEVWPLPTELVKCVVEQVKKFQGKTIQKLALEIVNFIQELDAAKSFEKELEVLKNVNSFKD